MRRITKWLGTVLECLEPLWVAGLAVLLLQLGRKWLPLTGEAYEWAQYLLLGTVFPLCLLTAALVRRPRSFPEGLARLLKGSLALVYLLPWKYVLKGAWEHPALPVLAASQGLALAAVVLVQRRWRPAAERPPLTPLGIVVGASVFLFAWVVAVRWVWWAPFPDWVTASGYSRAVAAAALVLVAVSFVRLCWFRPEGQTRPGRFWLSSLPALAVLFLASSHVYRSGLHVTADNPFGDTAYHHWGAIIGPAQLVRQGGWLLWDVPAQYGFLSTLTIAWLPFPDVWQAGYTVHAALLFLSASFLFLVLRSLLPGALHYGLSLLVTLAAVFLIPGVPRALGGPFITPAVGAFRFFWCYALLAVLLWAHCAALKGARGSAPLWVGCLTWLAGTLWSAESAAYCLAVWVPAYVFLVLGRLRTAPGGTGRGAFVRRLAAWLALPPALLAAALTVISASYVVGLGHLPDWYAFAEYCFALQAFAVPIAPTGGVWVLLLVTCAVATAAFYALRGEDRYRDLPLLAGAGGALWATGSYFVGHSHEANATNLAPIMMTAVALTLFVLARQRTPAGWHVWVRLGFAPVVTVLLMAAFWRADLTAAYARDAARGYRTRVHTLLPRADADLCGLIAAAGIRADTPTVFLDNRPGYLTGFPVWDAPDGRGRPRPVTGSPCWLPAASLVVYMPLSEPRKRLYFERFAARTRTGGWLIQPNEELAPPLAWIIDQAGRTHVPVRSVVSGRWRATWYAYGSADAP
jgi:hypothetical protein